MCSKLKQAVIRGHRRAEQCSTALRQSGRARRRRPGIEPGATALRQPRAREVENGAGLRLGLLDELEADAIPTDEDAVKIRDVIAALGGVPGTEHLQPLRPETDTPTETEESDVNGWEEELVGENAG